jgi:nicotinamide-nucleotide amidase
MFPAPLQDKIQRLQKKMVAANAQLVVAESCTGGLLCAAITSIDGASDFFRRGYVVYSNHAKRDLLGVPKFMIEEYGQASPEVARAMAQTALDRSNVHFAVAITGVAGDTRFNKPKGTVFICVHKREEKPQVYEFHFDGNRNDIQLQAVEKSVDLLLKA